MRWTVKRVDEPCGVGAELACVIPAGDPVAEFNRGRNRRCRRHAEAMGCPFDEAAALEVELERARLELDLAHAARARDRRADPTPGRTYTVAAFSGRRDRAHALVGAGAPRRAPAPRKPEPARAQRGLHDPRSLAANDREE